MRFSIGFKSDGARVTVAGLRMIDSSGYNLPTTG